MKHLKTMTKTTLSVFILISLICSLCTTVSASRLEIRKAVFEKADILFKDADTYKTRMYAPDTLNEAIEYYTIADEAFKDEKTFKEINDNLTHAKALFEKALSIRRKADIIFTDMEKARKKAHSMRASRVDGTSWDNGERLFKRAVVKLEKGATDTAQDLASEAIKYYRKAEINAVKTSYMTKVWDKIELLEMNKDQNYAPKTLSLARELAEKAERSLEKQPYGNEQAQTFIKKALKQAERSEKISRYVKNHIQNNKTYEDIIIETGITIDQLTIAKNDDIRL